MSTWPAAPLEEAEHAALLAVVAERTDGLEQRGEEEAVGADGQQREDHHHLAKAREGRHVEPEGARANQADRD